jgi:hypothetical protein
MPSKTLRFSILALLAMLVIGIASVTVYFVNLLGSLAQFPDAYASDWTAIFVIEHLKSTDGEWPRSWDDLRDEYDTMAEPSHYAWSFTELQERVVFDWTADVDQVANADPPIGVFRLASGKHVSFDGDPNVLIRDYLVSKRESAVQMSRQDNPH